MKLNKASFDGVDTIEITNIKNINILEDSPSVLEIRFDESKTWNRVVTLKDGFIIGVNERFTFVNNFLKNNPSFDIIISDDVREFELG